MAQQPPMPTIRYVLLAMVARRPSTGREIAERMKDSVGYFWSAPHSQIYPQLAQLVEDGLVAFDLESEGEIRPRKRYRPTASGRRLLRTWLSSTPDAAPERDEVMVRAYSVSLADRRRAARMYTELARRAEDAVSTYQALADELRAEYPDEYDDPSSVWFGNWATLQAGLSAERGRAAWCRWMADRLLETHE